jgi:hypothetical protein
MWWSTAGLCAMKLDVPLRRRVDAALDIAPDALVGRDVRIYWDGEDAWYLGTVTAFSEEDHLHSVLAGSRPIPVLVRVKPNPQSPGLSLEPVLDNRPVPLKHVHGQFSTLPTFVHLTCDSGPDPRAVLCFGRTLASFSHQTVTSLQCLGLSSALIALLSLACAPPDQVCGR